MDKIVGEISQDRRRFFGTAAMAVATTQLGMIGPAAAQRVGAKMPAMPADAVVDAEVDLNLADGGYFLSTRLNISLLGVERRSRPDPGRRSIRDLSALESDTRQH
jgi:hypothetical protein